MNAELLAYLAELDQRKLFLDLGFPSLFAYCVESLGLSESTAGRYIAVARVCHDHPHALALVARGELHASALSLLKHHLTAENATELFALCSRKSARGVELLLAARFPRPDVRDAVRRLPNERSRKLNVERAAQESRPDPTRSAPTRSAPVPRAASHAPNADRIQPLSQDRYGVHFTADGEFRELIERVRDLAGHRLPSGDLLTLVKRGLEAYERELAKERFAIGKKPFAKHVAAHPPLTPKHGLPSKRRRAPAEVTREVFNRDRGQCAFVSANGKRCTARKFLELDHIRPHALGGTTSVENLRLLCKNHNQHAARQSFGRTLLRAAIMAARSRRQNREAATPIPTN